VIGDGMRLQTDIGLQQPASYTHRCSRATLLADHSGFFHPLDAYSAKIPSTFGTQVGILAEQRGDWALRDLALVNKWPLLQSLKDFEDPNHRKRIPFAVLPQISTDLLDPDRIGDI
jgi:hypothetical protein